VLRSNLPLLRGAAAVREFFFSAIESGLEKLRLNRFGWKCLATWLMKWDRYSALVPGTAGKRREERGKYLWVFAKQSSGDWKLVSEVLVERPYAIGRGVGCAQACDFVSEDAAARGS